MKVAIDYPGQEAGADGSLLVDRDTGTIWLFYAHAPEGIGTGNAQPGLTGPTFQYHTVTSDDDGQTWSKPRDITPMVKDTAWNVIWPAPGRGLQTRNGRLIVPSTRGDARHEYSHLIYSDDHGTTWHTTPPAAQETCEPQVVELADGSLMINMRSDRGKGRRAVATSSDGGKTWSPLIDDPTLIEPVCQASFIRYTDPRAGDGKNRLLFSNPASSQARKNMTVRLSYDEGKTWPISKVIHPGPASYSCQTVLRDGTIGLFYERGQKGPCERISFARFNLEWLTE
jgi:sialidase-1